MTLSIRTRTETICKMYYPHHRIENPTDSDYANTKCQWCSSSEVIWLDQDAEEVECYDCGTIFFLDSAR